MLYNERFYENKQLANDVFYIRQAGILLKDSSYVIERDDSPTNSVLYIENGVLNVTAKGEYFRAVGGDTVIVRSHIKYKLEADTANPPTVLWINVRGKLFEGCFDGLFKDCIEVFSFECRKELEKIFDIIKTEGSEKLAASVVCGILINAAFSAPKVDASSASPANLKDKFDQYVMTHIQGEFSVEEMAAYFMMSKDKLYRLFNQFFNKSPYSYYQENRIEIAKSLLINSNMTINDIASRLLFAERNYFSLYFKQLTGYSPAYYRKTHSAISAEHNQTK